MDGIAVVVETEAFTSELVVPNFSEEPRTVSFRFRTGPVQTPDKTAGVAWTFQPGQQVIVSDIVDMVYESGVAEVRVFLLELVERPHGGIKAAIRFEGVPIGVIDGLAEHEDFLLGVGDFSGEPILKHPLGAVEYVLLPGNGNDLDAAAGLLEHLPKRPVGSSPGVQLGKDDL